ncbi:hypothetical protein BCR24_07610 [Enterococcus ureilyticus]|uniref:Uncharacterized protein n=1 Tax=Enterococcus ureilyticus TaxID=1131292 RepID=A0A1E5H920_9ENTE|nr:hypothetical protein [Enterococcus ureilyticus]MBM7687490.1 hypothetical protein [Enterococcus ureilyticus]MBO0445141.1 hypothetical protein [Enterococcus ureilyticus]OEG21325.1 hypothetical protein BCR24_07610 [Enterococcus ureilyticus]
MIIVKKVNWIDIDSGEADILLSDGTYSIECFCSDCNFSEGDTFSDILYGFNVRNIVKSFNEEYVIDEKNGSYSIQGKLVDKDSEILQIGEFKIDISDGDIPKDIDKNDYLEVDISRIDIY